MERIIEKNYTITNLTNSSILLKNDNLEDRKIMVSGTIHLQFDIGEKVRIKDVYNDDYHKLILSSIDNPNKKISIRYKRKKKVVFSNQSIIEENSIITSEEVSTRSPLKIYTEAEKEILNNSSIISLIKLFKSLKDTNDTKSWTDLELLLDSFGFKNISNQNENQIYLDEITGVVVFVKKHSSEDSTIESISICGEIYNSSLPFQGCIKTHNDKTTSFYSTINYGIEFNINLLFANCQFIPKWRHNNPFISEETNNLIKTSLEKGKQFK